MTVNGIISVLQAAKSRDVLSPSTTGLSFYFKGLCRRTQSPFRMIRIQAATTRHPKSMAADVPHFGGFIFTATAALRVSAITIFSEAAFVKQIPLFETSIIK